LVSTTSAQHGTGAAHKMQHTTGAAACSKHTRSRQHAAGNVMHGMRDETKGSRKLAHLDAASGSLRRPWGVEVGLSEFAEPVPNNEQTNKQRWLQHTAPRSPTAASASWPRCTTSGEPCPGRGARRRQQSASTECRPAGSGEPRTAGRVRPGPCLAGRLTCRGRPAPRPGQARPARAVASAEKYRPGGQYPAAILTARLQPAATLLRRWRWISDHRHTIILLPSPYSDKVLRSLSLTAGSSAG
jgi:hypothetical protein